MEYFSTGNVVWNVLTLFQKNHITWYISANLRCRLIMYRNKRRQNHLKIIAIRYSTINIARTCSNNHRHDFIYSGPFQYFLILAARLIHYILFLNLVSLTVKKKIKKTEKKSEIVQFNNSVCVIHRVPTV